LKQRGVDEGGTTVRCEEGKSQVPEYLSTSSLESMPRPLVARHYSHWRTRRQGAQQEIDASGHYFLPHSKLLN
jgi:hypothetical protein